MRDEETPFTLHPRLDADSVFIKDMPLSQLRLIKDSRFVWCLLVPRRVDIANITQLTATDYVQLMAETRRVAQTLESAFACDRINIGALGNIVPQLHMHVIARRQGDAAWPGPVWGSGEMTPLEQGYQDKVIAKISAAL